MKKLAAASLERHELHVHFYEQPTVKFLRYLMRIYTNTRSFSSKLEFTTSLVEWGEVFRFELSSSSLLGLKSLKIFVYA